MKDARTYEKKVKKLLAGKTAQADPLEKPETLHEPAVCRLIEAVILSEAPVDQARSAIDAVQAEFVDFNELRVAPIREIAECFGKNHPAAKTKASELATVLNNLFEITNRMTLEPYKDLPKREVRRRLRELGCSPFAEALVAQSVFDAHAIPVDEALFEILRLEELVHPDSNVEDTQAFLERIIAQKDGPAMSAYFREYVSEHFGELQKHRQAEAKRLAAEAEAAAKAAAEKARKEEEKRAREEEEKRAREEAKAQKAAEKAAAKAKTAKAKSKGKAQTSSKAGSKTKSSPATSSRSGGSTRKGSAKKTTAQAKASPKTSKAKKSSGGKKATKKKPAAKSTSKKTAKKKPAAKKTTQKKSASQSSRTSARKKK